MKKKKKKESEPQQHFEAQDEKEENVNDPNGQDDMQLRDQSSKKQQMPESFSRQQRTRRRPAYLIDFT